MPTILSDKTLLYGSECVKPQQRERIDVKVSVLLERRESTRVSQLTVTSPNVLPHLNVYKLITVKKITIEIK